jgi:hypothetical protein
MDIYISIPESIIDDAMSSDYLEICSLIIDMEDYFDIELDEDYNLHVNYKEKKDTQKLIDRVTNLSQRLIAETINIYTSNINYETIITDSNYLLQLKSPSLLQSIFLEIGNILNNYDITICKYRKCNLPVISSKNRPALCCSHNHLTDYLSQQKRDSR